MAKMGNNMIPSEKSEINETISQWMEPTPDDPTFRRPYDPNFWCIKMSYHGRKWVPKFNFTKDLNALALVEAKFMQKSKIMVDEYRRKLATFIDPAGEFTYGEMQIALLMAPARTRAVIACKTIKECGEFTR